MPQSPFVTLFLGRGSYTSHITNYPAHWACDVIESFNGPKGLSIMMLKSSLKSLSLVFALVSHSLATSNGKTCYAPDGTAIDDTDFAPCIDIVSVDSSSSLVPCPCFLINSLIRSGSVLRNEPNLKPRHLPNEWPLP